MIFSSEVIVLPDIPTENFSPVNFGDLHNISYPSRPMIVTCFGSCWFGSLSCLSQGQQTWVHLNLLLITLP